MATDCEANQTKIDLVWEVASIARVIGRSPRQTVYMLSCGELPAKKVGGRWVAERGALLRFFTTETTTGATPGSSAPAAAQN